MDGSSFDRITRRLAVTTTRRGGIAALVAGALGIAGFSAAEARPEPSATCEREGARCESDADCCSDRCRRKFGISRCAPDRPDRPDRDKNKKKKKKDNGGGDGDGGDGGSCTVDGDSCSPTSGDCCEGLTCFEAGASDTYGTCGTCTPSDHKCSQGQDTCCSGFACRYNDYYELDVCQCPIGTGAFGEGCNTHDDCNSGLACSNRGDGPCYTCRVDEFGACTSDSDCSASYDCVSGTCQYRD